VTNKEDRNKGEARKMKTARDRLEFAIRFAQLDLDRLRPGDPLNLRDDLESFHGYGPSAPGSTIDELGGIMGFPLGHPLPAEFAVEDFKKLQAEMRSILGSLAEAQGALTEAQGASVALGAFSTFPVSVRYAAVPFRGASMLSAQGPTRDMTLLRLFHLIAREDSMPFRKCPDPECGRIFYRVRRQLYCSKKCVNRMNKRAARRTAKTAPATPGRIKPNGTRARAARTSRGHVTRELIAEQKPDLRQAVRRPKRRGH
jgi:hypothetical protein